MCRAIKVDITEQKMKFSIKDFFSNCDQNLCSVYIRQNGYQLESGCIIKKVLGLLKALVTWLLLIFPDAFL